MTPLLRIGGPFGAWGIGGVLLVLVYAIARLLPVALEALRGNLAPLEWAGLAVSVLGLGYVEGVRAFQKAFSPRVVARAATLDSATPWSRRWLSPLFCMGLFAGTPRRLVVGWGTLVGVTALVFWVRTLPQPWRGIIDAGVIVALTWGALTLVAFTAKAMRGDPMPVAPDLPAP